MKELSVFVDESGDFGGYEIHSPYYIVTMVFHDQDIDITEKIDKFNMDLANMDLKGHCIHTGPIIRQEEEYRNMSLAERRRILNKAVAFTRSLDIKYKCFYIEKKHLSGIVEMAGKLSKQISLFIRENYIDFLNFQVVKIYYDNGQVELTKILSSVFNSVLNNVEFKRVLPSEYKVFQIADLICTFKLIEIKLERNQLSNSENLFFGSMRDLKKNYIKPLKSKEY